MFGQYKLVLSSERVLIGAWDNKSPNISLGTCTGLKRNKASLWCIHLLLHENHHISYVKRFCMCSVHRIYTVILNI